MVEGKISPVDGWGRVVGTEGAFCEHEVDTNAFPEWSPKFGKIWRCKLCGAKVYNSLLASKPLGERVRISKKDRKRQRAIKRSLKVVEDTLLYGQPLDKKGVFPIERREWEASR
jgi:hypothetical protein